MDGNGASFSEAFEGTARGCLTTLLVIVLILVGGIVLGIGCLMLI